MERSDLELRRRRCLFRAEHRGTKEMDWLLGRYAAAALPLVEAADIGLWEEFVVLPDPRLHDLIMGVQTASDAKVAAVVTAIRTFHGLPDGNA